MERKGRGNLLFISQPCASEGFFKNGSVNETTDNGRGLPFFSFPFPFPPSLSSALFDSP